MRTLARAFAAAALLAGSAAGCAAAVPLHGTADPPARIPRLPPHREIQEVVVLLGGRTIPAVAHLALHASGEIRVHLGSEGGLTGLDVSVLRGATTVHSEGPLLGPTGSAERVAADLARVFGDRSLFAVLAGDGARVPASEAGELALPLADGSLALVIPADLDPGAAEARVLLLDPRRVPEARVTYAEFGEDGIPRSISLRDLRDGHRLEIDVVGVLPPREGAP